MPSITGKISSNLGTTRGGTLREGGSEAFWVTVTFGLEEAVLAVPVPELHADKLISKKSANEEQRIRKGLGIRVSNVGNCS
jgi:hypothetical protein